MPIRLSPIVKNIHILVDSLADESLGFRELAAVLDHYPVIAARILALANSAWAAPAMPVTTLENACARLGVTVVKSMMIAIAVASSFNQANCPAFDGQRFWLNSFLIAEGASLLAQQLPSEHGCCVDTTKTAGIIHGIGLLWMAEHLPIETGRAIQQVAEVPLIGLNQALQDSAGGNYCWVSAWIAKQWHLPDVLVNVLQYHQDASYRGEDWAMSAIVGAALNMAMALPLTADTNLAIHEALLVLGIDQDKQHAIFEQLALKYEKTALLAREIFD